MFEAIKADDVDLLDVCTKKTPGSVVISAKDVAGMNVFMVAASSGSLACIGLLLGASICVYCVGILHQIFGVGFLLLPERVPLAELLRRNKTDCNKTSLM
jgi:hypothetical protein